MTIMGEDSVKQTENVAADENKPEEKSDDENAENMFSEENLTNDSIIKPADGGKDISITPDEKAAFIESVATNERFTKQYSLFGGKITMTLRSLTTDEVNALAAWTAKKSTTDAAGIMSGKYRKFLAAAHCEMLNGVEMPPLDEPLFERVGSDGKTVDPPGWVSRGDYFDSMGYGQFQAIMKCIKEFDAKYAMLCSKAEDSNFWAPDTP